MFPALRIKRLRIETGTADGLYGVDIGLRPGLNLIHADNTLGKTTCIQALIFALGLEGSMGPSRNAPLKNALTRTLRRDEREEVLVMSTDVYLEIANATGDLVTISRSSIEGKQYLIRVWRNEPISAELLYSPSTDYFVRMEGVAQRERGFHHFLVDFIGLSLPIVVKYDGSSAPLYLEALFSLYYVEQTRGWGGIQNTLPTYLGIQQLAQRVIEFTLALDAQETIKKRQQYIDKKNKLAADWSSLVKLMEQYARDVSGYVVDLPESPKANIDFVHLAEIMIPHDRVDFSLSKEIGRLRDELATARRGVSTVDEVSEDLSRELDEKTAGLSSVEEASTRLLEDLVATQRYVESIQTRVLGVQENLRKYQDVQRLAAIGSPRTLV